MQYLAPALTRVKFSLLYSRLCEHLTFVGGSGDGQVRGHAGEGILGFPSPLFICCILYMQWKRNTNIQDIKI